jgi:hypothetical protein
MDGNWRIDIKHILVVEKLRSAVLDFALDEKNKMFCMADHETICGVQGILENNYKTQIKGERND